MNCPRTEDLSTYMDQALPARAQAALQQHLSSCPVCRLQRAALQALRQDLQALPAPTLGFDLAAQLQDRLPPRQHPALQRPARPRRPGWDWSGWMPAGLAAGVALASGMWLGGLLLGGSSVATVQRPALARVFDPVPPGGLCAAAELCRPSKIAP